MILEVAALDIKPGFSHKFEESFQIAKDIIVTMPGYISHELYSCLDKGDRYILLVRW
jgi:heme-degrading monooxygenase HmoA